MSKITSKTWKIEPHTEAKHFILVKYLGCWLPILGFQHEKIIYIDGFAGPGEYENGQEGSPIIALKAALHHKADIKADIIMAFIEEDERRFDNLNNKINELKLPKNIKVNCINGQFENEISAILDSVEEKGLKLAPTFALIDPCGVKGVPISVIKRIMDNSNCEVMITFMYEEMNRFAVCPEFEKPLTELFGTDEWKGVCKIKESKERLHFLKELYKRQLESLAGIKHVRHFKMINKNNCTDYFLFFGTNSNLGLSKMKEAMWKVDKTGLFQFSDATYNPNQPVLFEEVPDYSELKKLLLKKFKGQTVTIRSIESFIDEETPFLRTHYKVNILKKMESAAPPEIKVIEGNKARRVGTYADKRLRIKFL